MPADTRPQEAVRPTEVRARPLLPPRVRPLATVALAGCVAVTVLLAGWAWHRTGLDWLDAVVDDRLHVLGWHHGRVLNDIADLGDLRPIAAVTVALALACLAARRLRAAVLAAVSVPAASALTEDVLKPLIGRAHAGGYSFPSGHTTASFAVATVIAVLMADPVRARLPAALRLLLTLGALAVAIAVAVAVIALGFHFFTDTIGGAAVAISVVLGLALVLDLPGFRAGRTGTVTRWRSGPGRG